MDISRLSKKSGIPASTLRYYEEKKLIESIGRDGLKRLFDSYVFEQLEFIALGQRGGFSLEDIQSMLTTKGQFEVNREKLKEKADEIGDKVKQLTAIQRCLEHAAKCSAKRHSECPTFQKLLRVAGKAQARKRQSFPLKSASQ
ncbi:helix-turn-helix domain-containing protein [Paraglaciecola arctica]|nr:helix-turn-helix domain-containing protein [Paraglaciecola arctica]